MYQALNATSKTLSDYLRTQILADPFLNGPGSPWHMRSMQVTLNTPAEMVDNPQEGLSLWLYRIVRDPERLNDPPSRAAVGALRPPPLPLRLHYMITPITSRDNLGDPETEQYVLGKVMQILHSKPVLRGTDLRGEFVGSDVELTVRLEALNLDEIARVWDALEGSYQLCVSYEVSVVNIDSALEAQPFAPVEVVVPEIGLIVS
jgi:Pvc16 N-terminal domain